MSGSKSLKLSGNRTINIIRRHIGLERSKSKLLSRENYEQAKGNVRQCSPA